MRRFLFPILLMASIVGATAADTPPPIDLGPVPTGIAADPVRLTVPRATLQLIGQGVMKLPYEVAAPILNEIQTQLTAQDRAAAAEILARGKAAPPPQ